MRLLVAIVAVCLAAASCHGLQKAPEFTLNLDLPPQQRFTGAVTTIVDAHGWDNSFGPVFNYSASGADLLRPTYGRVLQSRFPERYAELQSIAAGMAAVGHPEVNMTTLVMLPFSYESSHIHGFTQFGG